MTTYEIISVVFSSVALLGTISTYIAKLFKTRWLKVTLAKEKHIVADYFEGYRVTLINTTNNQHTVVKAIMYCNGKQYNSVAVQSISTCFRKNTVLGAGESITVSVLFDVVNSNSKRKIKFVTDQANVVLRQTQVQ